MGAANIFFSLEWRPSRILRTRACPLQRSLALTFLTEPLSAQSVRRVLTNGAFRWTVLCAAGCTRGKLTAQTRVVDDPSYSLILVLRLRLLTHSALARLCCLASTLGAVPDVWSGVCGVGSDLLVHTDINKMKYIYIHVKTFLKTIYV